MSEPRVIRIATDPEPLRPRDHAEAARKLGDAEYLAYVLCQACKLFLKLIEKRWPGVA